jgi:NTE family protein
MTSMFGADRKRSRPITAFVLSGGGNQGVGQVGMLRALLERDYRPDVIIGTSVGALNGSRIATSPTLESVDDLEEVWLRLRGEDVFPGNALRRAWNLLRRDDHLFPNDGLRAVIAAAGPAPTFEELAVPLRVVATDLMTGDEHVFVRGPLHEALLGSAALPGIFPPVVHNGFLLVDGAVVNLIPISHALAGPVDRIVVLDVSDPITDRPIRSPLDVAIRSFAISRDQRFLLELQWVPPEIDVIVLPAPRDDRDFLDFSGGREIIDDAYHRAMRALDEYEATPRVTRPAHRRPHRGQRRRRWFRRAAA